MCIDRAMVRDVVLYSQPHYDTRPECSFSFAWAPHCCKGILETPCIVLCTLQASRWPFVKEVASTEAGNSDRGYSIESSNPISRTNTPIR